MASPNKRKAAASIAYRPYGLTEIKTAGESIGMDICFEPVYSWIAEELAAAPVPTGWQKCLDEESGSQYYYNYDTGETAWEHPSSAEYRLLYQSTKTKDEAEGRTVIGMASRARQRRLRDGREPPPGSEEAKRHVLSSIPTSQTKASKQRRKKHRNLFKKAAAKGKMMVKLGGGGDATASVAGLSHLDPNHFAVTAEMLGIAVSGHNAKLTGKESDRVKPRCGECYLLKFVCQYLDRTMQQLPEGWEHYYDSEGRVVYYHSETAYETLEHPCADELRQAVATEREGVEAAASQRSWYVNDVMAQWAVFAHRNSVYYYNFATGARTRSAPSIAREAAELIAALCRAELPDAATRSAGSGDMGEVGEGDLVAAFKVLDKDSSGSISLDELAPVMINLGGMSEAEVQRLVREADSDGDGEVHYEEFVALMWSKIADAKRRRVVQAAAAADGASGGGESKGSSSQQQQQKQQSRPPSGQSEMARARELMTLASELEAWCAKVEEDGLGAWSMEDYATVMNLLATAADKRLGSEEYTLAVDCGGPAVVSKCEEMAREWEAEEAVKHIGEKTKERSLEKQKLQLQKDIMARQMAEAKQRLNAVKVMEFKDAVVQHTLNGFLYPEVQAVADACVASTDLLVLAKSKLDILPSNASDLKLNATTKFLRAAENAVNSVARCEEIARQEMGRRAQIEQEAAEARRARLEMQRKREEAAAEAARVREEEEAKAAREAAAAAAEALRVAAEREREERRAREAELAKEKAEMERQMAALKADQERRAREAEEWQKQWERDLFGGGGDGDGDGSGGAAERKSQEQQRQRRWQTAEEVAAVEEQRLLAARLKTELERKEAEIAREAEATRRQEEQLRKEEAEIARVRALDDAKFMEVKLREMERQHAREEERRRREEEIARRRAAVDAGEDDDEEEVRAREAAVAALAAYEGTVFDACRQGDVDLLRCFFLVKGSKAMLRLHNRAPLEGGRTLLHTAVWWGNAATAQYLIDLGADVNGIDLTSSRTTPLMEGARAGRKPECQLLLASGAKLSDVDCHGDTAVHIAARSGWGSLITALLATSERCAPGSTKTILKVKNFAGNTAADVARNQTIGAIIAREEEKCKERASKRTHTVSKFKRGMVRAKVLGANVGGDALRTVQAQHRRYGRMRQRRKKGSGGSSGGGGGSHRYRRSNQASGGGGGGGYRNRRTPNANRPAFGSSAAHGPNPHQKLPSLSAALG